MFLNLQVETDRLKSKSFCASLLDSGDPRIGNLITRGDRFDRMFPCCGIYCDLIFEGSQVSQFLHFLCSIIFQVR